MLMHQSRSAPLRVVGIGARHRRSFAVRGHCFGKGTTDVSIVVKYRDLDLSQAQTHSACMRG